MKVKEKEEITNDALSALKRALACLEEIHEGDLETISPEVESSIIDATTSIEEAITQLKLAQSGGFDDDEEEQEEE